MFVYIRYNSTLYERIIIINPYTYLALIFLFFILILFLLTPLGTRTVINRVRTTPCLIGVINFKHETLPQNTCENSCHAVNLGRIAMVLENLYGGKKTAGRYLRLYYTKLIIVIKNDVIKNIILVQVVLTIGI